MVARIAAKGKPAKRSRKPVKRANAKKPQVAQSRAVSAEGKRDSITGRFTMGNGGGPGRPSLAGEILKVLAEMDERTGHPNVHQVAVATVALAKTGSLGHVQLIIDRTDGRVAQAVELTAQVDVTGTIDLTHMGSEDLVTLERIIASAEAPEP